MPKSPPSPSRTAQPVQSQSDKLNDVALRKKKNADAQAAFRARRANYIATLEETVTSLEAVVVQLQDSCREARQDANDLRQENARLASALENLRHESRERDKYLRALWNARKANSDDPTFDDFPPAPPSFNTPIMTHQHPAGSALGTPVTPISHHPHGASYPPNSADALHYSHDASLLQQAYSDPQAAAAANAASYGGGDRSPGIAFLPHDADANGRSMSKMAPYSFNGAAAAAVGAGNPWNLAQGGAGPSGSETVGENGSATHSPAFMHSPAVASSADVNSYGRYAGTLDQVGYSMLSGGAAGPVDRSISPSVSSPHNGSSSSVNSQFQFSFPIDNGHGHDRDEQHRRMTMGGDLTLHGGTADVSGYAMNRRRAQTGPERPMLGSSMPSFRSEDLGPSSAGPSGEAGPNSDLARGVRRRRGASHSNGNGVDHASRSPSPTSAAAAGMGGHPPISSTLAVIKAQAFGALRRTRARPKKATEGAAKVALEVLEARGIGLGIGSGMGSGGSGPQQVQPNKRQKLSDDEAALGAL